MDKFAKLSQAIRVGSTFRPEYRAGYIKTEPCRDGSCALGAGHEATFGTEATEAAATRGKMDGRLGYKSELLENLADRYSVPYEILAEISTDHFTGRITRLEAAERLEALGY